MAVIQSVQSGSKTIVADDGASITINLGSSVTLAQSVLVCTWSDDDNETRELRHTFTEELSSTQITLTRNSSSFAKSVVLEWYVYEFDSSVSVQRGKFTPGSINSSQTISSVNTDSTFIMASFASDNNEYFRWTVDLTSSTNINFDSVSAVRVDSIAYQVVEFDSSDVAVQKKTGTISGGSASTTATITSVTTSDTFIAAEYGFSANTFASAIRHKDKATLDSSTQITIARSSNETASVYDYVVYVVEMLDGTTVQKGTATIADTGTGTTATITALSNGGMFQGDTNGNQLNASSSGGLRPEDLRATQSVSGTTVTFTRAGTLGALEIEWAAIDWNASETPAGISGSISETLEDFTGSASGELTASGSISETLEETTSTASGLVGVDISDTIAATLEDFTSAASGQIIVSGSIVETLEAFSSTASGTVGDVISGTIAQTLEPASSTASGALTASGTIGETLEAFTMAGIGGIPISGAIAAALEEFTMTASGTIPVTFLTPTHLMQVLAENRQMAILAENRIMTILDE